MSMDGLLSMTARRTLVKATMTASTLWVGLGSSLAQAGWFRKSCDPTQFRMERSVELNSLFKASKLAEVGNGGFKVDIPVSVDGQRGCFSQSHGYRFGYEKNKNGFRGSIRVKSPEFEFENINDARIETYVQIENTANPVLSQIRLTSFVCAGESVLSVHTFSNQIRNIANWVTNKLKVGVVTVMATGAAAKALEERTRENNPVRNTFDDFFAKEYLSRTHYNGRIESLRQKAVSLPAVYLQSRIKTPVVEQESFYKTSYIIPLGCTKEFSTIMRPYHLSQLETQVRGGRIGNLFVAVDDEGFEVSWR